MPQANRAAQEYFSEDAMKTFEDKMMTSSFGTPADAPVRRAGEGGHASRRLPKDACPERRNPARMPREASQTRAKTPEPSLASCQVRNDTEQHATSANNTRKTSR